MAAAQSTSSALAGIALVLFCRFSFPLWNVYVRQVGPATRTLSQLYYGISSSSWLRYWAYYVRKGPIYRALLIHVLTRYLELTCWVVGFNNSSSRIRYHLPLSTAVHQSKLYGLSFLMLWIK
jgi:hypothetical protein